MRVLYLLGVATLLVSSGCSPRVDVNRPFVRDSEVLVQFEREEMSRVRSETHVDAWVSEDPAPPAKVETVEDPAPISVSRRRLRRMLRRGVSRFLTRLDVTPRLDLRQRFTGWEIQRIDFENVDLRPGDVVTRINGYKIERPGQAYKLWRKLRRARRIRIVAERDGTPFVVRIRVRRKRR